MVKMINLQNQNAWLWDRGKLMNRKFVMQDHYQKYMDGEDDVLFISKEQDPFWDPPEDLFCGLGVLFLQSLAYRMDFEDKVYIYEFQVSISTNLFSMCRQLLNCCFVVVRRPKGPRNRQNRRGDCAVRCRWRCARREGVHGRSEHSDRRSLQLHGPFALYSQRLVESVNIK